MSDTYKIQRYYQYAPTVTTRTGLTREQAQIHCGNPETSSYTATDPKIDQRGAWFDGFTKEVTP